MLEFVLSTSLQVWLQCAYNIIQSHMKTVLFVYFKADKRLDIDTLGKENLIMNEGKLIILLMDVVVFQNINNKI